MSIDALFKKVEAYRDQMVELQRELVRIPALGPDNGGDGEAQKAEFLKNFLIDAGFERVEEYPIEDSRVPTGSRPNLSVSISGKEKGRTLWFMAHMDVVPPGDLKAWNTNPFELVVKGDYLYGRGTEDNHQGLVSSLFALKAFLDLGIEPPLNLGLLLVADEETGSRFGIEGVLKHYQPFGPRDVFVVPDAGAPDSTLVEIAEKGILWLKITTLGKQCHASTPDEGKNAFVAASFLVTRLRSLYEAYAIRDPIFDPPYSTFEPTKKEANVDNVNTIPGKDVFYVDCRVLPQNTLEEVKDTIRQMADEVEEKFGVKIEIEEVQREEAAPATPVDHPLVTTLIKGIKEVYGVDPTPQGIGGGTVAAFLRRAGYPAVVWSTLDDMAHQPNEYCKLSNMLNDTKVFTYLAANMR